ESRNARPFNDGFGSPTATHQVELIEDGSGRNGFYVFQFVSRKRRENIANASPASSSCGRHFASGMHKAAVPDRSKQDRKSKIEPQNARAQIAARERDRMPRPKSDIVKYPAILPECNLAFGTAGEVVKYRLRHPLARDGAKILNAYHPGRRHSSRRSRHLQFQCPEP